MMPTGTKWTEHGKGNRFGTLYDAFQLSVDTSSEYVCLSAIFQEAQDAGRKLGIVTRDLRSNLALTGQVITKEDWDRLSNMSLIVFAGSS